VAKKPQLGLTADNFSFAKARISFDPSQETVRQAHGGKWGGGPAPKPTAIRSATKFETQDSAMEFVDEDDKSVARGSSSRRSIQPPKRYATADAVFYNEKKPKMSSKASANEMYEHNNREQVQVSPLKPTTIEPEPLTYMNLLTGELFEIDDDGNSILVKLCSADEGGMEMGMLPPKYEYPKEMDDAFQGTVSGSNADSTDDFSSSNLRRGRPPKPGGKKDMIARARSGAGTGNYYQQRQGEHEHGGPMFGISALTQASSFEHYGDGYVRMNR
jgi:hypothetical protein